jgi:phosphohistidine phosphatase SixA
MTEFRYRRLLPLLVLLLLSGCGTTGTPASFELILIRHAEKSPDGRDPDLTRYGAERAEWLAQWLATAKLSAVWSSDYRRTRQTAAPVARERGLQLRLYDPGKLDDLATVLLTRSENALVVGHSNTTPDLASLLCGCPVEAMSEEEYDRIMLVRVSGEKRELQTLNAAELRRSGVAF